MIKVLLVQATPDSELIDSYPTMPLGNPIDILNELVPFYFDKIINGLFINAIVHIGVIIRIIGAIKRRF
jgi:hypothetical protein